VSRTKQQDEFIDQTPNKCMCCQKPLIPQLVPHCHEIETKAVATGNAWNHPCNFLKLCGECHQGRIPYWGRAKQLALKLARDFDRFDLCAWLRIKDPDLNAPDRVTIDDILPHLDIKGGIGKAKI
jgi:hypothetical protein